MNDPINSTASRREFLKTSTTAALGGVFAANLSLSQKSFAANDETLRVGLIGCGGRGSGAAGQALKADRYVALTAMGDVFENQLQNSLKVLRKEAGDKVQVPPEKCFVGLDAYQKVLESGVDVVILATPPGFRPQHLKAAVEAGKHIFCEKPMATDAPGLRSVLESVEVAKRKNLALVAGFCWRYNHPRRELFKRIHDGVIGEIRAIYATYYTSPVKPMPAPNERPADSTDLQWQLRNWYNFVWLCGDGLVEQAVHSIDKIAWALKDSHPISAVAVGGRQTENYEGNIYDHMEVNYEFANGVRAFMGQRQITGCYNQNADYILGTKGTGLISVRQRRDVEITGENPWEYDRSIPVKDMYQVEHDELFASIRSGFPINDGVRMANSTMMAIMGRMAAYTGQEITWEQAINAKEQLVPENLDFRMKLPITPMAIPGKTKLI
ncbi:MAG: Gfo/Idh/MocA family oxidoreductase [Verrucomicrobiales bacterium]|nr:Gfo/Idh/MocA family oxidoreductase [Verrucomicrobiales bacterium]